MKLDAVRFGIAFGIVWSFCVLFLGVTSIVWSWGAGLVKAIGSLYIGYGMSFRGIIVGMVWAFFDAGIGGFIIATIYNWLLGVGKK